MGGVFRKKRGKWGVVKKWTFPQRSVHMYRVHYVHCQYFFILHFNYLGGGCVRIQLTPCLRACHREDITTGNPPKCPFTRRGDLDSLCTAPWVHTFLSPTHHGALAHFMLKCFFLVPVSLP